MLGRKRRLPAFAVTDKAVKARLMRQACNFPVQSTASDLTCLAMAKVNRGVGHVIGNVHDSILLEVPMDMVSEVCKFVRVCMEDTNGLLAEVGAKDRLRVVTPVEIKVGKQWGQMEVWNGEEV
jgi:DNA polymerase I-like protein with 3'-5' exonuclease and polymerase domains